MGKTHLYTDWVDMGLVQGDGVVERKDVVKPRRKPHRAHKYGATRTEYGGRMFDSKLEAAVAKRLIEGGYPIAGIEFQAPFTFACGAVYKADFLVTMSNDFDRVVVEAKGLETDVWRLKEKLFRHEYPDFPLIVVKKLSDLEALRDWS